MGKLEDREKVETLQGVVIGPHHNCVDGESKSREWKVVSPDVLGWLAGLQVLGARCYRHLLFTVPLNQQETYPQGSRGTMAPASSLYLGLPLAQTHLQREVLSRPSPQQLVAPTWPGGRCRHRSQPYHQHVDRAWGHSWSPTVNPGKEMQINTATVERNEE